MIVIEDERDILDTTEFGTCEECGKWKRVRPVFVSEQMFGGAPRGYYSFCFDCHGPVIRWKKSEGGAVITSPARVRLDDAEKGEK